MGAWKLIVLMQVCMVGLLAAPLQESTISIDGTWYREDGVPRKIFRVPEGIKLITENEAYIYYRISENVYQMNWTPGIDGTRYRWTMTIRSSILIENKYENESLSGTLTYSYKKILE